MSGWTRNLYRLLIVGFVLGVSSLAIGAESKGLSTAHPLSGVPSVGITSVIVKTVTGILEDDVRQLAFKDDIYHNETIETFDESATEITFLDDTLISLGPNGGGRRREFQPSERGSTFWKSRATSRQFSSPATSQSGILTTRWICLRRRTTAAANRQSGTWLWVSG